MMASVSVASVAYWDAESTFKAGAAFVRWISAKAARPSSDSHGSTATDPAPAPRMRRALRRVTTRALMIASLGAVSLDLADRDVLEAHAALAAGVELQCDHPVRVFRGGVHVIDGRDTVDPGPNVGSSDDRPHLVPAAHRE